MRELLCLPARGNIHDRRPSLLKIQQFCHECESCARRHTSDLDRDIVAAKALNELTGYAEAKLLRDVLAAQSASLLP